MILRIAAIAFIYLCTCVAWLVLGGTIVARTESADARLKDRVVSTWGGPHSQQPPTASYQRTETHKVEQVVDGRKIETTAEQSITEPLPLERSRVRAALGLDYRQKGLLWYSTYGSSSAASTPS
jgi:hypothetical protein